VASVVVVIPSRGRPAAARQAIESVRRTAVFVSTSVVLAVDADDPCYEDYLSLRQFFTVSSPYRPEVEIVTLRGDETGSLVRATNTVSRRIASAEPDSIIGNIGDDHRVRTTGFDRLVTDALAEPGIAYGDDLIHGERLPSAPFVSAALVDALGWYFIPTVEHMYGDDALRVIGLALRRIHYLPEMIVEHMHPAVNKGPWDDGYTRAYASVDADREAYNEWHARYLKRDLRNVTRALGYAVPV
jgi:hypothetical protein